MWSRWRSTVAGLLSCSPAIDREGVRNIRLVRGDGVDVLEYMFGPDSLTGVRVFFPDPWPKARHHKRRLLQPATMALIADRLRPGGVLHAATDHAGYAEHIAEVGDAEPRLRRVAARRLPMSVAATRHEVRGQSPARGQPRRRTALGEMLTMSLTEDIQHIGEVSPPRTTRWPPPTRPAGCCWSGTLPTWTWAWARSSAAAPPPRTGPASTRWAVGCCRARPNCRRRVRTLTLEPEATVFTNIAPGSADVVRPWVEALRNVGFAVFAKPKIDEDSDVDIDMLNHIALRRSEGLAGVLVASADGQAFKQPLEEIARDGVSVQVLGFREHASWALASDTLEFVDLEDIPGVFREPLPRIGLDSLPEQGAWLQPFRPLSSLLTSRVNN